MSNGITLTFSIGAGKESSSLSMQLASQIIEYASPLAKQMAADKIISEVLTDPNLGVIVANIVLKTLNDRIAAISDKVFADAVNAINKEVRDIKKRELELLNHKISKSVESSAMQKINSIVEGIDGDVRLHLQSIIDRLTTAPASAAPAVPQSPADSPDLPPSA